MIALDSVATIGNDLATHAAEPLRADRARVLTCCRQQRRGLLARDVGAGLAIELRRRNDLARLAAAAAVEVSDKRTQRLGTVRENQFVELRRVVPVRRRRAASDEAASCPPLLLVEALVTILVLAQIIDPRA